MGIHWKIQTFRGGGGGKKNQKIGRIAKKGRFADLRWAWQKRGWCFWDGGWYPHAHYFSYVFLFSDKSIYYFLWDIQYYWVWLIFLKSCHETFWGWCFQKLAERQDVRFAIKMGGSQKVGFSKKGRCLIFFTVLNTKLIWLHFNY